jgi:hypothetical protein
MGMDFLFGFLQAGKALRIQDNQPKEEEFFLNVIPAAVVFINGFDDSEITDEGAFGGHGF